MDFNLQKTKTRTFFRKSAFIIIGISVIQLFGSCQDKSEAQISEVPVEKSEEESTQRLGHIVLQVSDLKKSQAFYEDVLHMTTSEEAVYDEDKRIFLTATNSHHELVLKEGLQQKIETEKRYLQQLAFNVKDRKHLAEYFRELKQEEIDVNLADNRISWSLYFYDPDSVYIEIYWDIRDKPFGEQKTNGIQKNLTPEQLLEAD